ncbi:hypothetical protein SprV_0401512400 [Sparganum proliferum]
MLLLITDFDDYIFIEKLKLFTKTDMKDIIVIPADKGTTTVVMIHVEYNEKTQALLNDQQSYKSASASQAKSMIGHLTGLLSRLRGKNAISLDEWRNTKPTDTALAKFYGLPKIHKPNGPLRPIVALKGSRTYNLAKWMSQKLNFLREGSVTSVNSASLLLADIRRKTIRPDQIMVSFDVVSLFMSIPPELARDVLRKRLEKTTYEQIKGTPMGSPISYLVAELVLQKLKKIAFSRYKPAFWRRYVDDAYVIIEKDRLSGFQDLLNSIFPDIQFPSEDEEVEKLPFLDVLVTRTPDRTCASASDKRDMPLLQCLLTDAVPDDEAPLNLVACSVMSVGDNRVLYPLNLHDLYVHVSHPQTTSSTTLPNASASSKISKERRQTLRRGIVETLIQRRCSEIRHLSIRLCKPTNDDCRSKCIRGLPSLAKDYFLPIIEKCGPNLQFLEVSAVLITACCSDVLTTRRLRRLQDKCLNVRKATVIASDDMVFEQQFRPSAKNISTYLNLFSSLKTDLTNILHRLGQPELNIFSVPQASIISGAYR